MHHALIITLMLIIQSEEHQQFVKLRAEQNITVQFELTVITELNHLKIISIIGSVNNRFSYIFIII